MSLSPSSQIPGQGKILRHRSHANPVPRGIFLHQIASHSGLIESLPLAGFQPHVCPNGSMEGDSSHTSLCLPLPNQQTLGLCACRIHQHRGARNSSIVNGSQTPSSRSSWIGPTPPRAFGIVFEPQNGMLIRPHAAVKAMYGTPCFLHADWARKWLES